MALQNLVNHLIVALISFFALSSGWAQDIRRISPDRFPEMRIEQDTRRQSPGGSGPALSLEDPLGTCQNAAQRALCLRALASQSSQFLSRVIDAIQGRWQLDESVSVYHRQAWAKSLREADRRFRFMREEECGLLALSEEHGEPELYLARLGCEIRRNLDRAEALAQRHRLSRDELLALVR
jgi:hypothetical protein